MTEALKLNQKDLCYAISETTGYAPEIIQILLDEGIKIVTQVVAEGGSVEFRGHGKFFARTRKGYWWENKLINQTENKKVFIPDMRLFAFQASKDIKKYVRKIGEKEFGIFKKRKRKSPHNRRGIHE